MAEQNRPRQTWRSVGQANRKRDGGAAWRRDITPAEKTKQGWSWRAKLGTGLLALAVLAGGLVWLIYLLIPPRVPYWVAIGTAYAENLAVEPTPHAYLGQREALQWLAKDPEDGSWWGKERPRPSRTEPLEAGPSDPWFKDLDASFREESIVIYLSLHGYSDSHDAFLVGDGSWSDSRIAFTDVLNHLEQLPDKKNKLLILDAVHTTADAYHGMLHNDFVRRVKDLNDRIERIPNLAVLVSCDEDERSWTSDDWHSTIFAHYVLEGLKGAADANHNGRVDAEELYKYVRLQVRRWVWYNRDDVQQPILLPANSGPEKARHITLSVVKDDYKEASQAPPEADTVSPDLISRWKECQKLWNECQELASAMPAPAAYSPQAWNEYRDVLLRIERLERAAGGDAGAASRLTTALGKLQARLNQSKARIESARSMSVVHGSDDLALPLPAVLGQTYSKSDVLHRLFDEFWANPDTNRSKWDEIIQWAKTQDHDVEKRLPTLVAGLLLDQFRASARPLDTTSLLDRAAKVLEIVFAPERGINRPAELHFLDMVVKLLRDMPPSAPKCPPPIIVAAVQTRLLAEEIALSTRAVNGDPAVFHPYSEQVYPWIQERIKAADEARRLGEDRLFSSRPTDWEEAEESFALANRGYSEALKIAGMVRRACRARDEVFADLPYYAIWLTSRHEDTLLQEAHRIWKDAHDLASLLRKAPSPEGLESINEWGKLAERMKALRTAHLQQCEQLVSATSETQERWRQIEAALSVPSVPSRTREDLLRTGRDVSRRLFQEMPAESEKDSRLEDAKARHGDHAKHAMRSGKLVLAALGRDWFNDPSDGPSDREAFTNVGRQLDTALNQEKWWQPLAQAGDTIGTRWQQMSIFSQKTMAAPPRATLAELRKDLAAAEALSRQIPSFAQSDWTSYPALEARRLRIHGLLIWQAKRVYLDHWYAYAEGQPIYYEKAVRSLLDDAADLAVSPDMPPETRAGRLADVNQARHDLQPASLSPVPKDAIALTDQTRFAVDIQLNVPENLPNGLATIWIPQDNPAFALASNELTPDRWGGRRSIAIGAGKPLKDHYDLVPVGKVPSTPDSRQLTTKAIALFRGQKVDIEHGIELQRQPHVVIYEDPYPNAGSIAIAADDKLDEPFIGKNSALVIIMDCSGSMEEVDPGEKDNAGKTRFKRATEALGEVLSHVAPDTQVSLWVFGQNDPGITGKPVDPVENTIFRLVPPVRWDPTNKKLMTRFMQVTNLHPYGITPLMRTMLDAKGDFEDVDGHKVMLVLTDGMDTHFQRDTYPKEVGAPPSRGDATYNPNGDQKIADYLPVAFRDSGIELKIVGFQLHGVEKGLAEKQFKKPLEALNPPGEFLTVDKQEQLIEQLKHALRPVLWCNLNRSAGAHVTGPLQVPRSTEQFKWVKQGLEPGHYDLNVGKHHQDVVVGLGDVMKLKLTKGGYAFAVPAYGGPHEPTGDWLFGVPHNRLEGNNAVQMLVTLERKAKPTSVGTLKVVKPHFIYFELTAKEKSREIAVDWKPAFGFFAPAWQLDVKSWPSGPQGSGPVSSVLDAYWLDDDAAGQLVPLLETVNLKSFPEGGKELLVDGTRVFLQRPEFQAGFPIDDGGSAITKKDCLVLRMRYEKDNPVMVQIPNLSATGSVHRYYKGVRQYSAIFGGVTADQVRSKPLRLQLVSLNKLKERAITARTHVTLQLDAPRFDSAMPERFRLHQTVGP